MVPVDDGGCGMPRHDRVRAGREPFGVDLRSPDFVAPAGSFGVAASAVDGFGAAFRARPAEYAARSVPDVLVVRTGAEAARHQLAALVPGQGLGYRT